MRRSMLPSSTRRVYLGRRERNTNSLLLRLRFTQILHCLPHQHGNNSTIRQQFNYSTIPLHYNARLLLGYFSATSRLGYNHGHKIWDKSIFLNYWASPLFPLNQCWKLQEPTLIHYQHWKGGRGFSTFRSSKFDSEMKLSQTILSMIVGG